jgi:uncharacterized protein (DUF58 family)
MPIHKYRFFAPTDAARVSKLQFTARQAVEGVISGMHKSPHKGFSVEFSEHREYVPGDELRHMDWQAYARSDRYYIKLYEQETNLRATLVIDTSASMKFGNKIDYARHLAACIAYLLSTQQDLAGLVGIDERIRVAMPAGSSPAHLDKLFKELEKLEASSKTELAKGLHAMAERLPRRSMVILISDFWVDPEELARALQHLRYRRHQGMIIHLLDKHETELPYENQITLQDLETGEKLQVDPADIRTAYIEQVQNYLAQIRRTCNDSDIEYHTVFVDEPYEKALVKLMTRRA